MTDPSPVAELREAARNMKADAELALSSRLSNHLPWRITDGNDGIVLTDAEGWVLASAAADFAPHIAGMHPGVALALADWLDAIAGQAEQSGLWVLHALSPGPLKLARTYLRTEEK